jgi:diguanylate cyclase (GGDEF)-like protein/PAS domain S-box-containing protein
MGCLPICRPLAESPASCDSLEDGLKRAALDAAPDGILLVDRGGTILMVNAALEAMSGYSARELIGGTVNMLLPQAERQAHVQQMANYFDGPCRRPMGLGRKLRLARKNGEVLPVDIAVGHSPARGGAAVAFVRDMSEVRQLEARMHYQATHDTLTGLFNRWQFGQRLEQAIVAAERSGEVFALLLLDLDDFKAINDGYGHAAGDQVLIEVACRLRSVLGEAGTLGRMGGDEFTVLLPGVSLPVLTQTIDALLRVLCRPCRINHFELSFGASMGVAMFPEDARDAATLMRYADMAMYQAKQCGRGHYALYARHMGQAMAEKVLLHERLKLALENDGLMLHYQPQVDVETGQLQAVEALLRWHDDELGSVSPDRFVPVAESTGLILSLGAWVIDAACRQIAAWVQAGTPLRVAVNLSAQQLRQSDLAQRLEHSLRTHGAPPHLLELEVTESAAMTDPEQARQILFSLQALGVCVVLDDFGTGYSSLAHLRLLPVSSIKIDRVFIGPMLHSEADAKIVQAVIALAKALGLRVVAEGVERPGQLRCLHRWGCDAYQGWLYSKAVPAREIARLRHAAPSSMAVPC